MPMDNLLPWYLYLSEDWEPQDIHLHYQQEVGVQEEEEEDFSTI